MPVPFVESPNVTPTDGRVIDVVVIHTMEIAEHAGNPEWAIGQLSYLHIGDLMESGDSEGAARVAAFGNRGEVENGKGNHGFFRLR